MRPDSAPVDRRNRGLLILLGVLFLAAGGVGLAASFGAFGASLADAPPLTSDVRSFAANQAWFWWAAGALAVLMALLGLAWIRAQLSTERVGRLDLVADATAGRTVLDTGGLADAVEEEVESYRGVRGARAQLLGASRTPYLRLQVDLEDRADLVEVRERLTRQTVPNVRTCLERPDFPLEVRLRLPARERRTLA